MVSPPFIGVSFSNLVSAIRLLVLSVFYAFKPTAPIRSGGKLRT